MNRTVASAAARPSLKNWNISWYMRDRHHASRDFARR